MPAKFFANNPRPAVVDEYADALQSFVDIQVNQKRRVAVITSGGTTVPLERNTVRYLDNFSEGRRGSSSAEEFISNGYSVIFLHRKYSLQPYTRRFMTKARNFLDHLYLSEGNHISVVPEHEGIVKNVFEMYNEAKEDNRLLCIPYVSVNDYLFLLKEIGLAVRPLGHQCLFYLAAAVSDFYIPYEKLSEHKIQSGANQNGLDLHLYPIPKMLGLLANEWSPEAYVVSFKLETKDDLLKPKIERSLRLYNQNLVVGNLLKNHQEQVFLCTPDGEYTIVRRTKEEKEAKIDIETKFVPSIADLHATFLQASSLIQ